MTNDIEHTFLCLLTIWVSSFVKFLFVPILIKMVCQSFLHWFVATLYIFWKQILWYMYGKCLLPRSLVCSVEQYLIIILFLVSHLWYSLLHVSCLRFPYFTFLIWICAISGVDSYVWSDVGVIPPPLLWINDSHLTQYHLKKLFFPTTIVDTIIVNQKILLVWVSGPCLLRWSLCALTLTTLPQLLWL